MSSDGWKDFISYVNSHKGETLTLVDFSVDLNHIKCSVLQTYKCCCFKYGFMKKCDKGSYKIIKKIPMELMYKDVRRKSSAELIRKSRRELVNK